MTKNKTTAISISGLVLLILGCRLMDHYYTTHSHNLVKTCVTFDLQHQEIEYSLSPRCELVVESFKLGRESKKVLP